MPQDLEEKPALDPQHDGQKAILARIDACTCFHDVFAHHRKERPDRIALQDGHSRLSYSDLPDRAERLAARLVAFGLKPGDRIALLAKNDVAFVDLTVAASMAGLVLVLINFRLAQPEIDFILNDSEARLIFTGAEFQDCARIAEAASPHCEATVTITPDGTFDGWCGKQGHLPERQSDGGSVLFQMYTSGTTGQPKGVLLTHENVLAVCRNGVGFLGPSAETSHNLVCMPLFHIAGSAWLFLGLVSGGMNTLVVDIEPEKLLQTIAEDNIDSTLMVPAVIQMLVLSAEAKGQEISGLETVVFGASPMPAELLKRAQAVFPETDFIHVYGMTETTGAVCALDPAELRAGRRLESCGKPFPDSEMRIVDAKGDVVPDGEVGEIVCKTPQMTTGYWNRPEATAKAIRGGWYHTGDAGSVDAEGFFYIRDRIKDMMICGGENVYPAEVENAILAHPSVAEVAVIGVPDEKWGEVGCAFVVLKPDTDAAPEAIQVTVRERLAGFKVPQHVKFCAALPRNGAGKVTKQTLRETVS